MSLTSVLPYLYACIYIHPNADDWWFAAELQQKGRIDFALSFYQEWSGRYTANVLLALPKSSMVNSPINYVLLPIIFVLLTYAVVLMLFKRFVGHLSKSFHLFVLTSFIMGLYITNLIEPFSALYWNCASYYLLANVFFIWFLAELMTYFTLENKMKSFNFIRMIFAAFLSCGLTEIFGISMIVLIGFIILYQKIKLKVNRFDLAILLIVVFTGFILNVFSPGAQNRMEVSDADTGFIYSAIRAGYDLVILQLVPLITSGFIVVVILILITAGDYVQVDKKLARILSVHPLISLFLTLFIFYLHHAASLYGAGYTIQGRVLNITNLLLYLSFIFISLNAVYYFKIPSYQHAKKIALGTTLCMAFLFNFSSNSRIVIKESFSELVVLDNELNQRYEKIQKAKESGETSVQVERVSVKPRTLSVGIYNPDENFYNSRKCTSEMSQYFGLEISIVNENYDEIENQ